MAGTNPKVIFKFGTRAQYDALSANQIQDNALYFLLDTNELYRGTVPICQAHYYEGTIGESQTHAQAIAAIVGASQPVVNDILVLNTSNGIKYPYIYAATTVSGTTTYNWRPLHGQISGDEIVFDDGETLLEKLSQSDLDYSAFDEDVFTVIEENNEPVGLTLKDFGVKYYDYVEGEYVLTTVDNDHPWPTGLVPRVVSENGRPVLGWFVPDPTSASGQEIDLTDLRRDVADLKSLVGKQGSNGQPSTGLIHEVETKVGSIKIRQTTFTPVDGTITLPLFDGSNDGVVPQYSGNDLRVLGSNGNWIDPNTLFSLEWEELSTT